MISFCWLAVGCVVLVCRRRAAVNDDFDHEDRQRRRETDQQEDQQRRHVLDANADQRLLGDPSCDASWFVGVPLTELPVHEAGLQQDVVAKTTQNRVHRNTVFDRIVSGKILPAK